MVFTIDDKYCGLNIYEFLNSFNVSKSLIYKLETNKLVKVNNEFVKFNYLLSVNDVLTFPLNEIEPNNIIPFKGPINIIYEDNDLLIVNKPPFLLVHTDGNTIDTLANRVSYYLSQQGYEGTIKHVHRLDYETSGIVIFAKHFLAHSFLSALFEQQNITKTYVCICQSKFKNLEGIIDAKIGKDRHQNKQRVSKTGKSAISKYKVIVNGKVSKVEIKIIGGRKHQIRVHMASINHPIVGDKLYGNGDDNRLLLHFQQVRFTHPRTREVVKYYCPENF